MIKDYLQKTFKIAIITLSTRAANNIYKDASGEIIYNELNHYFSKNTCLHKITKKIIPDSKLNLLILLLKFTFLKYDLIITTGGTGISKKDITPEIVKRIIKKELPGISEYVRQKYAKTNINALCSRSIFGVRNKTIIASLPGSPKAVIEYISEFTPMMEHLYLMIHEIDKHKT